MKKKYVRLLFLFLIGVLCLVFWLLMHGIEPYPVPVYPAFSNVQPKSPGITIIKPDFIVSFASAEPRKVDYYQLFNNIPISHVNHLVINNLNPLRRVDPGRFQDKPFKSFKVGRSTVEWRRTPHMPSPQEIGQRNQFLRNRITLTTGQANPTKLEITWYEYHYVYGKGIVPESRRPVYERSFDLTGMDP